MSGPYFIENQGDEKGKHFVGIPPYKIGKHSYVGELSHISQNTYVGNFCSIANLCTLGAQQHPTHLLTTFPFEEILSAEPRKPTIIGNDVWIGSSAVVIEGVKVGDGSVIGAGAIVTKDVPPYAIVVGNPARLLRYRFTPDIIEGLLEIQWWDLKDEFIRTLPFLDPIACIAAVREIIK